MRPRFVEEKSSFRIIYDKVEKSASGGKKYMLMM
jgi:hypothetical protein